MNQSNLAIVRWTRELRDIKIRTTFSEEVDWYGNRSVSVLHRKFLDWWNSLRVPDRARFRTSAWFTWLSRNLAAVLSWQRPQGPESKQLMGFALSCTLALFSFEKRREGREREEEKKKKKREKEGKWLSLISSFYVYTLNFRLSLFLSNYSILFSFARPVCIRPSLVFRFTWTCWYPTLPLFPIAHFLFYL